MSSENFERSFGDWIHPVQRQNLSDTAYQALRNALMGGQLAPGQKLHLRPISQRFNISVTPMREALFRLVAEKALDMEANGTVVVSSLTVAQLIEIRQIRKYLEGTSAETAASIITTSEIDKLEEIHNEIAEAQQIQDFDKAINLNTKFHLELCKAAKMPVTYEMVENLFVRCGPILSYLYERGVPSVLSVESTHPHIHVIEALKQRNGVAASREIRNDIEVGGKHLLNYVMQDNIKII